MHIHQDRIMCDMHIHQDKVLHDTMHIHQHKYHARQCRNLSRSIIGGNLKIIGNILGVEMSTVKTGAGGLLWQTHVSGLSDNDKAAIM